MSIFDHPDVVPGAPSWRCPHCRTLQPESSRCRACSRSAVTCGSCHRYQSSVASDLGYCADDKARTPLYGDEVRSCWASGDVTVVTAPGLFDDPGLPTSAPADSALSEADAVVLKAEAPPSSRPDEADESPETRPGGLVEAPHVAPGRRLASEVHRRSRQLRSP